MSKKATKALGNMWYEARYNASAFNERLGSREGAAEELGMDRTRLARIELGSLVPYPEEVLLMADLYNAPELKNNYCCDECSLGCNNPRLISMELDRIALQAISKLRKIEKTRDTLIDITEDGVITRDELPDLESVIRDMDEVTAIAQSLKLWAEKNLRKG